MRRRLGAPLAVLAALALGGCFAPLVVETLEIELTDDGSAWVRYEARLASPDAIDDGATGARRRAALERMERDLLAGEGEWSDRFDDLGQAAVEVSWRRAGGRLREYRRAVRVDDLRRLREMFDRDGIDLFIDRGEEYGEVSIAPGHSRRARSGEREIVEQARREFAAALFDYYRAAAALERLVAGSPARRRAAYAELFDELFGEAWSPPEEPELDEDLAAAVASVLDRAGEVAGIFAVDEEVALSLEEMSRRVHDPFPAEIAFVLPADPVEVEGFERAGGRRVTIPPLGFWHAWGRLSRRHLAPDPLLVFTEHARAGTEDAFALGAFLARPRRVDLPRDAGALDDALVEHLTPAPRYRARWRVPREGDAAGDARGARRRLSPAPARAGRSPSGAARRSGSSAPPAAGAGGCEGRACARAG